VCIISRFIEQQKGEASKTEMVASSSSSNDVVTCGMSNDDDKVEAFSSIGR